MKTALVQKHADQCPAEDVLEEFVHGNLPIEKIEHVGSHLSGCKQCDQAIARLSERSDSFVACLSHSIAGAREESVFGAVREQLDAMEVKITDSFVSAAIAEEHEAETAPEESLDTPLRLGPYELLERIGHGAMGVVFRARHMNLERDVALKLLSPRRPGDAWAVTQFRQEMAAIGRFDHPNIVRATDAGEADGYHFLVMEFADGIDLSSLVSRLGWLPVDAACELVRQAALGLEFARQHGMVHRDVKPSNLLLTSAGQVKVLDLGLASFHFGQSADSSPQANPVLGTADYMAPEQWEDGARADARADVYSLGCTLYKLIVGAAPFAAEGQRSVAEKRTAHRHTPPPALITPHENVPSGLQRLLEAMMAKNPDDRPATPDAVALALEPFAAKQHLDSLYRHACESNTDTLRCMNDATFDEFPGVKKQPLRKSARFVFVAMGITIVAAFGAYLLNTSDLLPGNLDLVPEVEGGWTSVLPSQLQVLNRYEALAAVVPEEALGGFTVRSTKLVLAKLGEIDGPGTSFRVRIHQEAWQGQAGVFFGYQAPKIDDDFRKMVCHTLTLKPEGERFYLYRGFVLVQEDRNGAIIYGNNNYAFVPVTLENDGGGQEIAINFDGIDYPGISWNGINIDHEDWVFNGTDVSDMGFGGSFGILNYEGLTVFRHPQWKRF